MASSPCTLSAQDAPLTLSFQRMPQESMIESARSLYENKKYAEAEIALKKILEDETLSPRLRSQSMLLLGGLLKDINRQEEALQALHSWKIQFPSYPELPRVNFLLGRVYRDMQEYGRAREHFQLALDALTERAANPYKTVDVENDKRLGLVTRWEQAETEYQSGDWRRARQMFEQFKLQNPEVKDLVEASLYRQGDCSYKLGERYESIKNYKTALIFGPFHPFSPEAWLKLMELYGQEDSFDQQFYALHAFTWIVNEVHPEDSAYWQQQAAETLLQFAQDRPEEAKAFAEILKKKNVDWVVFSNFLEQVAHRKKLQTVSLPVPQGYSRWVEWQEKVSEKNRPLK
ncbi:MAG: hypothetical protein V1746_02550 [bacterium]